MSRKKKDPETLNFDENFARYKAKFYRESTAGTTPNLYEEYKRLDSL